MPPRAARSHRTTSHPSDRRQGPGPRERAGFIEAPEMGAAHKPATIMQPPTATATLAPMLRAPEAVTRTTLTSPAVSTTSTSTVVAAGPDAWDGGTKLGDVTEGGSEEARPLRRTRSTGPWSTRSDHGSAILPTTPTARQSSASLTALPATPETRRSWCLVGSSPLSPTIDAVPERETKGSLFLRLTTALGERREPDLDKVGAANQQRCTGPASGNGIDWHPRLATK
jgi:hypothetical protein